MTGSVETVAVRSPTCVKVFWFFFPRRDLFRLVFCFLSVAQQSMLAAPHDEKDD